MKESENGSEERTTRNREDMERRFSFARIYPRAVQEYGFCQCPHRITLPRISIWICGGTRFFAQSIPFTRRSRPVIGLKYSGEREARLFPVPALGRNSIERAEVPRLVVLRPR